MKILLAESAGFCFGVKRATRMAFDAAEHAHQICSLGPLIHSPQMVRELEEKGVKVVHEVDQLSGDTVIIRSHGVTAQELERILERDMIIVDATCPFVKKAQEHVALLSGEGYFVIIVGEKDHPEVQGIVSYARHDQVRVVANSQEAETLTRKGRIGIVAQTTQPLENLQQVVAVILNKCKELRVYNTICDATSVRQNETREIAGRADLMLVIGGHNSANTNRLAQLCRELQPRTYHVESAEELDPAWFVEASTVGITAGASTPRWIIDEVLGRVREIGAGRDNPPVPAK